MIRSTVIATTEVSDEPGRPHVATVAAAAHDEALLLRVASRQLRGRRALGSVSERLVHDAPCSVLILRPDDLQT